MTPWDTGRPRKMDASLMCAEGGMSHYQDRTKGDTRRWALEIFKSPIRRRGNRKMTGITTVKVPWTRRTEEGGV